MSRAAAAITAVVILLLGAGSAHADDPEQLERNITPLSTNITAWERNITPLESSVSDHGTTTIALQSDILFDFGSSELSASATTVIGNTVEKLPAGAEVAVDGHTDDVPYHRGNDVLSTERAQAVADAIAESRPDLDLIVTGHGDTQPVASNSSAGQDDPEGRAQNRRVEIRYDG
ncbi:MAG: OmpA family protein [Brachybacterium sp.]|nr:OmpA family protein [Brachybacterium sp.]